MTEVIITGLRRTNSTTFKTVFAYGMYIDVPAFAKFLTIDLDGALLAWDKKPKPNLTLFEWGIYGGYCRVGKVGTIRYSGNWEDSLVELP